MAGTLATGAAIVGPGGRSLAQDRAEAPVTTASEAELWPTTELCGSDCPPVWAERLFNRPIITPHMDSRMGSNINGPSLIRVPDWVPDRLGCYYLYFSHHRGSYIRMAYADHLAGPWTTHEPGVLDITNTGFADHIASPDVVVDEASRSFRMYFHGVVPGTRTQKTAVALSSDGLTFSQYGGVAMDWYARAFNYRGAVHALTMPGVLFRSNTGLGAFERGPSLFPDNTRHSAVRVENQRLQVFYTNRGDNPESVFYREINMAGDWADWSTGPAKLILSPERDYEGANIAPAASGLGPATSPLHQLRDPAIFSEQGRDYLIYSVAGEMGLAIAQLHGLRSPTAR
ncbi:hypothetical protein [Aurantiacibacter flavus]|uniref:Glycosyl hydrolase family 32 N-terminal domain-containing protein n=1 Tax=Aurantiacibacter flavus TaxID=3145232 RepID=A0ABV0D039_9SPHN